MAVPVAVGVTSVASTTKRSKRFQSALDANRYAFFRSMYDSVRVFLFQLAIAAHEIQHALGFWHEQNRYDRDAYVTVNTANVATGQLLNFNEEPPNKLSTYGIPYEYGSNMHYSGNAFASNTSIPTMVATDVNYQFTMGSQYAPTFLDILFINTLYGFISESL